MSHILAQHGILENKLFTIRRTYPKPTLKPQQATLSTCSFCTPQDSLYRFSKDVVRLLVYVTPLNVVLFCISHHLQSIEVDICVYDTHAVPATPMFLL
jgi:hypothetical protein